MPARAGCLLCLKGSGLYSDLGEYGKNNIVYVEGMGSFLTLYAFYTDHRFDEDNWHELKMMKTCEGCEICMDLCPGKAIRREEFVIDAGRCLTLYNGVPGEFPDWIPRGAHNALMGCIKCQFDCPADREVVRLAGRFETVTKDETRRILDGKLDTALLEILGRKLKGDYPATSPEYFPIFTRNLGVLIP